MSETNQRSEKAKDGESQVYPIAKPEYLNFNASLMHGEHQDLPNAYYKEQLVKERERNDYSHLTDNVIRSMIMEYGPLDELTEDKLNGLISAEKNGEGSMMEVDGDNERDGGESTSPGGKEGEDGLGTSSVSIDEGSPGGEPTPEMQFYKTRDELLQCVQSALGSSTLSLDFVSLLLSSVRPAAGSSSMSPHLKQNIKIGSLSCDKITPNITDLEDHENRRRIESMNIGRGWKLESLKKSSSLLKSSVERLRKNLDEETTYWNEVLDVLDANELITAVNAPVLLPKTASGTAIHNKQKTILRQKKVLAVKYGYADSGSDYFDNGIAVLKKGEEGHLEFEKLSQSERERTWGGEKIVSVKIFNNPKGTNEQPRLIGQSDSFGTLQKEIISGDNISFVSKVKNSRFFIFENELFWHLVKEAAGLITAQVRVADSCIIMELFDCCIHIESLDIACEELKCPTPELPQNKRADNIIKFFRILLCGINHKNVEKLNIPPIALTKDVTVPKNRHSVLIRPILMYTRHNRMINKFKKMLFSLLLDVGTVESEAQRIIEENLKIRKYINDPNELQKFKTSKRCYNNDPFLRVYSKMAPTSLLILKFRGLKIWIELVSSYSTLHTTINVKVIKLDGNETILESIFNSKRDVELCLSWILKQ